MRKISFVSTLCVAAMLSILCCCNSKNASKQTSDATKEKVVIAYVTSWSDVIPNPQLLTHINYAFGHVADTFDGVRVDNPERLQQIVDLKKDSPDLKVLVSVGGWGSGRFSEMAADSTTRKAFAADCMRLVNEYGLDGIDIDWEYPGSDAADISCAPEDVENFTLLMRDLRESLGNDLLLTTATCADPTKYYNLADIADYVDYVNTMTYDMANGPKHHAALHRSENTPLHPVDSCIEMHIAQGIPAEKVVMGVPFYGRGNKEVKGMPFKKIAVADTLSTYFDEEACASFVVNQDGQILMGYDDPRSLSIKCEYIKDKGLAGAMFWEYSEDDDDNTLCKVLNSQLRGDK